MSQVHSVSVIRDQDLLSLSPTEIQLRPGDLVEWNFEGNLDPQELVFIWFHSPAGQPFGPFQTLDFEPDPKRDLITRQVRGLGNNASVDVYRYTAFILKPDRVAARSDGMASVANISLAADTSPVATVLYDGQDLVVQPQTLLVEPERSAIWYIQDLPPGFFVTFDFPASDDAMVGPFSSFEISRGFGQAQVAIGARFKGTHCQYGVRLRRPDGSVAAKSDPVIEPPPGWPPSQDGGAG